jgi:hypothetical protein
LLVRTECRGGAFHHVAADARRTRLLTVGEHGDLILWDLPSGAERRRYPAIGADVRGAWLHPHDPWAVVAVGWRPRRAHRLELGSGRTRELWPESVTTLAFSPDGARVAVLFCDPNAGSRLAVFPEAALRADPPLPAPDFVRPFQQIWPERVEWAPDANVVIVGTDATDHHVDVTRGTCELLPKRATTCDVIPPACDLGGHRLDGAPGSRVLRGHAGPALQMLFDATGRWLALPGPGQLTVLDVEQNVVVRHDGSYVVHALAAPGTFVLLAADGVHTLRADANSRQRVAALPTSDHPEPITRYWHGAYRGKPFHWEPDNARLWLGNATADDGPDAALFAAGRATPLRCPSGADDSPHFTSIAMAPGANGDLLVAWTAPPMWCGTGLERVRTWGWLASFDRRGRRRAEVPISNPVPWLAVSPRGNLLAVPVGDDVRVLTTGALLTTRVIPLGDAAHRIAAFTFVDDRVALAAADDRLLRVTSGSDRVETIPLDLPGPITQLALSPDRRLVAIACGSEVFVYRRR